MSDDKANLSTHWEFIDCVEDDYKEEMNVKDEESVISQTCNMKKGNGILLHVKLEQTIADKFLCKFCIEEQLQRKKGISSKVLDDTTLVPNTYNAVFACCLTVTCKSGNHKSNVIPEWLNELGAEETMQMGENGKPPHGHPQSMY